MELIWEAFASAVALIAAGDAELARVARLSLVVSGSATLLSAALGVPLGAGLYVGRWPLRRLTELLVNTGMGLPPVVVGLVLTLLLWRTGPLGPLTLLYTPAAMVLAQVVVALPLVAGFTRAALGLLDADLVTAMRVDGAGEVRVGRELALAAWPQVLVAIAAGFGRAIAEVGASIMVGGNILGQTRIMTTAITLETSRGDFALALALGMLLLGLAFAVNGLIAGLGRSWSVAP